uniref:NADH-ubiquinone oxidoreductase chain 2 n=1 Tax=Omorgus chinensis TaxID=2841931 RepID=A0A8F0F3P5_9SCAR|nr:NADH dehydrogenase subunit 2 [Omorgus chinensis]UFR81801.1 NADH dehydrogenase subunit 2 [Trogidae sp.]
MFNLYKTIFLMSTMIGTLISISSYSWFSMWIGLEINLLSIIPLMSSTKNAMASEAALKYFIAQALASTILLFSINLLSINAMYNLDYKLYLNLILNTSLLTKMGAAPFHFWFPEVMEGLNWMNCMILLTWQKFAPMVLLMYSSSTILYLSMIIIISMMISGIMGLNQVSLRKILAYSSINHIGWMLSSLMFVETIWLYYFLIYAMISFNIIIVFKMLNIFYLKQLFLSMNNNSMVKFFFILNFLSLGGLPPFLGFLPKWLTIQLMIENNFYSMAVIMTILTLMTLYFYMRITFSTILLSMNELPYYASQKINNKLLFTSNFIALFSLIMCTLLFNFL